MSSTRSKHALIIGGGIIGLASAWELIQHGWRVTVLDAAPEAREASWAAAGMLAPHHEADAISPLWELGVASLARWPIFAASLGTESLGQSSNTIDLRMDGGLIPCLQKTDAQYLHEKQQFLSQANIAYDWLNHAALAQHEPELARTCSSALLVPAGQVNPRLVCCRLQALITQHGGELRYHTHVSGLHDRRVTLSDGGVVEADEIVLASGAWTPQLAALSGIDLMGEPVKGQMLRLRANDGLLRHFVHCHHAYLVPRAGLGIVVGATMVTQGFDRSDDPAAIDRLAHGARQLIPALADAPIIEQWTGLRPRLHHGMPVIARVRPGLIIATGHFRNGILLSPITATIVHALIEQREPPCDVTPFACSQLANS
jgi:glycine oxidase